MSASKVIVGAIVAYLVALICLLPPGIHFVSGPIGPAIGGYVSGSRFRLNGAEAFIVGVIMGIGIGGSLVVAFEYLSFFPELALQASIPLSAVAAVYVGALGAVGAWLASRRSESEEPEGQDAANT